jgi:hypothetical protein
MKKNNSSESHAGRNTLLLTLLAVCCVGGVELAASKHYDPALYAKVTTPAKEASQAAAEATGEAINAAATATGDAIDAAATLAGSVADGVSDDAASFQQAEDAEALAAALEAEVEELVNQQVSDPILVDDWMNTDPEATEMKEVDGAEILTGGNYDIRYFNQTDEQWANQPYGRDTIGGYGCGPTAMAMAVSSMTNQVVNPAEMAAFAAKNGYWASKSGSYHSIVLGTAAAFGLEAESFTDHTAEGICDAIFSGKVLVALMGPGHFTKSGHFILLRGITLDGQILVADSASRERSLTLWDPQTIIDELSKSTANGAPLWALWEPVSGNAEN